ncbi:MAG: group II intron reverse transcriptase/maturase [Candidatus Aenigmarchaeota archaeon]|nr:group II intron reverse transcriptase/maturase [Candidatus Aenigmarchaeota archaeon]
MRKWYSLIDKVYSIPKLAEAFEKVKKNKGSRTSGVDKVSIADFKQNLQSNLYQLSKELKSGEYTPQAVRRVYIDKPDGSKRGLGIPTIRDRVVQQSLLNVLQPIFEPDFHPSSYGYRPKRSAHQAVAKAERFSRYYGLEYVADMDLSKCFDTLDHKLILQSVNQKVSDGKVLNLITKFLTSGVLKGEDFEPTDKGSPQGGIISPLLMNIYLDNFDQYMKHQGIRIVRYADDILIFAPTKSKSGEYMAKAENYLEKELKLEVNRKKSHLTSLDNGIAYLGFVITSFGVVVSEKSIRKFKDKVRKLTPRTKGKSIHYFIGELNKLLQGFSNYYCIGLTKGLFENLMSWIRRRLRMMIMKAWKSWKPLHKQLRRMGYKGNFEKISVTRWRNSNSPLIHMALRNFWFEEAGLYQMEKVVTNTLHQYFDVVLNKV